MTQLSLYIYIYIYIDTHTPEILDTFMVLHPLNVCMTYVRELSITINYMMILSTN